MLFIGSILPILIRNYNQFSITTKDDIGIMRMKKVRTGIPKSWKKKQRLSA